MTAHSPRTGRRAAGRQLSVAAHLRAVLLLTRWREHVAFTLAATFLGVTMAAWPRPDVPLSRWHIAAVLAGNVLSVTFAFMLNDLEDAPDDTRDPARRERNALAAGLLSRRAAAFTTAAAAMAALALYALAGARPLGVGALTLSLAWLYSWRRVRLKALPAVDVISHALMLSALLFLAGYMVVHGALGAAWWAFLGVGWISAYGQLYNQLRDYDLDRAAGLRNTARLLGQRATRWSMYGCLAIGIICLVMTAAAGIWPRWLAIIPACSLPILWALPHTDMRGSTAIDLSGRLQASTMRVALVTVMVWLIACVVR